MNLIQDLDRSNSRINKNASQSRMGGGDDSETVKNSMINLLNVMEQANTNS